MTLRISVRPGPPPSPGPPRRWGRDALRGLVCGLVAGAPAFFLVTCVWYLSGRIGWRWLTDSLLLGPLFGAGFGLPIGLFALRPARAALLSASLAAGFELAFGLVLCLIAAKHHASPGAFGGFVFLGVYLICCGSATGSLAAVMLRSWSKRDEA